MIELAKRLNLDAAVAHLASFGAAPALIALDGAGIACMSYATLVAQLSSLATGLAQASVAPGTMVALIAPNGFDWVVARLGLATSGAIVAALDDLGTETELAALIRDSGCRHILASARHAAWIYAMDPDLRIWAMGNRPAPAGTRDWRELFVAPKETGLTRSCAEAAALIYTSGTTGPPKGFLLTYPNILSNLRPLAAAGLIGRGDRVLLPLPLHHVYPFLVGLLTPLSVGATVVFPEAISGPKLVQALATAEVSAIIGVPRLYAALASAVDARVAAQGRLVHALYRALLAASAELRRRCGVDIGRLLFRRLRRRLGPRLRLLVSGGAHLDPETLWPLVGLGFEVRSGYGLAETASIFTGNLPGAERLESEGKPFQGGTLRIAAPDRDGIGEIELTGPNLFSGYRHPDANRDAFTSDGWFRTGDLGRIDADGFLFVTGRSKETIVLGGGKKVNPEALERVYGSLPYIRELAVLERQGALVALVVPDLTAARGPSARIDETIRVALASQGQRLPRYERLAGFALARDPLPRTRLGKYRRFLLPALYERALSRTEISAPQVPSATDEALLAHPRARRLYDFLCARYPGRTSSLDASPQLDLGIDSIEWIALSLALDEVGLNLPEKAFAEALTIRDLLQAIVAAPAPDRLGRDEAVGVDRDWIARLGWGLTVAGFLLHVLDRIFMRLLFRLWVEGIENLPAAGPYVLVANHASDLDALAIMAALGYRRARRVYWAGDAVRLFGRRWIGPLWRTLHVFPADDRFPARTLATAAAVLARGDDLAWFPEGWRTPDGALQPFYPGIARIVVAARVPVVPIYIAGTFEALPRERHVPRLRPVCVRFGPALSPAMLLSEPADEAQLERIAQALRQAVAALEPRTSDQQSSPPA